MFRLFSRWWSARRAQPLTLRTSVLHTFLVKPVSAIITQYHVVVLFWKPAFTKVLDSDPIVLSLVHDWTMWFVWESCQLTILIA